MKRIIKSLEEWLSVARDAERLQCHRAVQAALAEIINRAAIGLADSRRNHPASSAPAPEITAEESALAESLSKIQTAMGAHRIGTPENAPAETMTPVHRVFAVLKGGH